jgi:Pro-kumamolisin, activation domain/Bacterial Ig-like domain (group 3)
MKHRSLLVLCLFTCLAFLPISVAQTPASRIVAPVDEANLVTLSGNTHPLARAAYDQGALSESTALNRMQLVLARSPEQEAALKQLLDQQQDRGSSSFHQWLTPQSFGATFGPSDRDLATVTAWLAAQGFTGVHVSAGRTVIEFSGTAGSVQTAFHTAMHRYVVNGQQYFANASDPRIPAALAPVVAGVASLNNFAQQPALRTAPLNLVRDNKTGTITRAATQTAAPSAATAQVHANYTTTTAGTPAQTIYAVTPGDLATIYNFAPLLTAGTTGTGQSIAVVGDSDINAADFINFRNLFGLPVNPNNSPTQTPFLNIIFNGPDPGTNADEIKGDADTQWAGAVATNATIDYVVSLTTSVMQGSDLSAQYIVDNNLAPVLVDSFNVCEANAGAAYNQFISSLWEQAAAQGITAVVSAGDNGSAGCDVVGATTATGGLAVNAIASTPFNVAVGGTDFFMPNGGAPYWSATNNANQSSVLGYVPETTWNDNLGPDITGPIVQGGSGGASSCATGSGTGCAGYTKPTWQTGVTGTTTDMVRDIPDVSLFAGDGAYGALYFVCQQDAVTPPNTACALGTPNTNFVGAGGTSFSAAAFAGMMALVNQKTGAAPNLLGQGNANYVLYKLAAAQQTAGTACNATGATPPASACIFNDVTTGNNQMPCATGALGCTGTSTAGPVLSGYASAAGYDLATGLGSINVANLVNQWQSVTFNATTTTLTLNGGTATVTIAHGQPVTTAGSVTPSSGAGTPTGQVAIIAAAPNGAVGTIPLVGGDFTQAFTTFPGSGVIPGTTTPASYQVHANYGGDGTFAPSESVPVNLIVTPENSTTTVSVLDVTTNTPKVITIPIPYGEILDVQAIVAGDSGHGIATGNVFFTDEGQALYGGTFALNSSGHSDVQTTALPPGMHSFVAAYQGDASFNPSTSTAAALTIVKALTKSAAVPSTTSVADNLTITFTVTIGTMGYGNLAPSGIVTLTAPGTTPGSTMTIGSVQLPVPGSVGGGFDHTTAFITVPASLIPNGSTVTVNYPGDTNYLPSTGTAGPFNISASGEPVTMTALTALPPIVPFGGSITLTATVIQPTGTASIFGGQVAFTIDGQSVGTPATIMPTTATLTGTATETISIAAFGTGNHTATAVYLGDAAHKSSSGSAPFTIASATGTASDSVTATVTPQITPQGTAVMIAAAVAATPSATPAPTGTVQLLIDGNFNGAPIALTNGAASVTLVTNFLAPGVHTAAWSYSGDATYAPNFSNPTNFTVTAVGNTPTTIVISNVPSPVGQGITFPFTATITPSSPIPTGTTELIIDGGLPQAQVPLPGTDPATLSLNTDGLGLGTHTVQVYYSGNTSLSAATSNTVTFDIIPQSSTFTLSPTTAAAHIPIEGSASNATTFTVTPTVGGTFSVSFACTSGLPLNVTCSFSPATVNVAGLATATTNLTFIVGNYPQASLHKPSFWYKMGGGVSFAGLFLLLLPRRNRRFASLLALLTLCALGAATGCGSGIAPQQGPFPVVVTATSSISVLGPTTQTATVNLTIGGQPSN